MSQAEGLGAALTSARDLFRFRSQAGKWVRSQFVPAFSQREQTWLWRVISGYFSGSWSCPYLSLELQFFWMFPGLWRSASFKIYSFDYVNVENSKCDAVNPLIRLQIPSLVPQCAALPFPGPPIWSPPSRKQSAMQEVWPSFSLSFAHHRRRPKTQRAE